MKTNSTKISMNEIGMEVGMKILSSLKQKRLLYLQRMARHIFVRPHRFGMELIITVECAIAPGEAMSV